MQAGRPIIDGKYNGNLETLGVVSISVHSTKNLRGTLNLALNDIVRDKISSSQKR